MEKEPKGMKKPDYIFESSWEVCNKVGGIYTVLSTRAKTLYDVFGDNLVFIGPDFGTEKDNGLFKENKRLLSGWKKVATNDYGLAVRVGRWNIPGEPIVVLVDFSQYYAEKDDIYGWLWENFQVDSLHAYGDYDEATMFSYAAGRVVESFYGYISQKSKNKTPDVVYQAHEWMTCAGALYLQKMVPQIATIFTTHATSIGRSIAGNNKPLYDYLWAYNGDQMARELNMETKHSIEKQAAEYVDCFTTVSDITARECRQLLETPVDVVLTNGFEDSFVPNCKAFDTARETARKCMLDVANALMGTQLNSEETLLICTGGRYEFKNKGIDLLVDSLNRLRQDESLQKNVLVFINVPSWTKGPRVELKKRLENQHQLSFPCSNPRLTHDIHNLDQDMILNQMNWLDMHNREDDKVKVIFVPCYLDGNDGIFNLHYYNLLIGNDLNIYPSYYEPWGYTPLESVAFHVPCITTDLAGFGLWVNSLGEEETGVRVVHRTDSNFIEAAEEIKDAILRFSRLSPTEIEALRYAASQTAEKALWKHFINNYYKAYDIALQNRDKRTK